MYAYRQDSEEFHLHSLTKDGRAPWRDARKAMEDRPGWRFTPEGPRRRWKEHGYGNLAKLAGRCVDALGLGKRAARNLLSLRLTASEVPVAGLPAAFDGYTLLHVSDPHFDAHPGLAESIALAARRAKPDLLVLTGDYLFGDDGPAEPLLAPMSGLLAEARPRDGALAVLGNHDTAETVPVLESLGVRCLVNETAELSRGQATLAVTGVDDVHRYFTPASVQALRDAAPFGGDRAGIALVHSPGLAPEAAEAGYGLYLCGHTHGGQVCLPGGHPLITQVDARKGHKSRAWARGQWSLGNMVGITSNGAGVSGAAIRFNAPPELRRIVLRRKPLGKP